MTQQSTTEDSSCLVAGQLANKKEGMDRCYRVKESRSSAGHADKGHLLQPLQPLSQEMQAAAGHCDCSWPHKARPTSVGTRQLCDTQQRNKAVSLARLYLCDQIPEWRGVSQKTTHAQMQMW